MNELESTTSHINADVESYLSHPVNQYHLLKRFAYAWPHMMEIIAEPNYQG